MIESHVETLPPIEVIDQVGSTNAELKRLGRGDAPHGTALRANVQTAGRGQRSHTWVSPKGGLYLSVLIRPNVPGEALPALPVACALGALGALREMGCPRVRLKWPNDIVVEHRKVAGILTELVSGGDGVFAVFGIGVNMEPPAMPDDFDEADALLPAGLRDELSPTAQMPSLDELAERIRLGILNAVTWWTEAYGRVGGRAALPKLATRAVGVEVDRWAEDPVRGGAEGPLASLLAPYNASLAFVGEKVRMVAIDGGEVAQGTFLGVDGYGHALVAHADGSVEMHDAADVSLRPDSL